MNNRRGNSLRYQLCRSEARKIAHELVMGSTLLSHSGIDPALLRYEPIDPLAVEACLAWGDKATGFPWEDVPFKKVKDRKAFDIAIWHADELCGLCYASPKQSRICIKIILLESNPDQRHPLKGSVGALALIAVDAYARSLGCSLIEVEKPDQGALALYRRLGFEFDAKGRLVIAVKQ